jgi:hypothetical protein
MSFPFDHLDRIFCRESLQRIIFALHVVCFIVPPHEKRTIRTPPPSEALQSLSVVTQFSKANSQYNNKNNSKLTMSFLDKMKKASKSVVDAGAKQMLKVSKA